MAERISMDFETSLRLLMLVSILDARCKNKTDDRRQKTDDRRQRAEDGRLTTEGGL